MFLKIWQNSQENTCARVSFLIKLFSCKFCENFKNTFLTEQLQVTTSKNDRYLVESNDFSPCFQKTRFLLKKVLLILAVSVTNANNIHNLLGVKKVSLKARSRFITELARFEGTFPWKYEKKQPTGNLCVVQPTPEQRDLINKLIDSRKAMKKSEIEALQSCHPLNNRTGM